MADAITQSIKRATVKEDPMSEGNAFVKRLRQIQAVHQPKVFDISQHDRDGLEKWNDHLLTFEDQRKLVTSGQDQGEHKLQKVLDAAQKRLGCVKKPVSSVKFPSHFADKGRIPESEWA